jgi:DNA-binding NarL/FixJ family response regulator
VTDAAPSRALTVLIVALDAAAGRVLASRLAEQGVRAVTCDASEPAAVVSAARRSGARVALVDLDLPNAGALAVLAALSALPHVMPLASTRHAAPVAARGEPVLSSALTRQLLGELASPSKGVRRLDARGVTRREREVLGLLAAGRRTDEVALDLTLSNETVRGHVKSALRKLGVRTSAAAVAVLVAERQAPSLG